MYNTNTPINHSDLTPIPNYPKYLISRNGQVYSDKNYNPRKSLFGPKIYPEETRFYPISSYDNQGYRMVSITNADNKRVGVAVHRLMAMAFYPNQLQEGMWVNHKDGNKANNCLENLEVDTPKHNHEHARDVLKRRYIRGTDIGAGKLTAEAAEAVIFLSAHGWSQYKLAKTFQVSQSAISNILHKKSWKQLDALFEDSPED